MEIAIFFCLQKLGFVLVYLHNLAFSDAGSLCKVTQLHEYYTDPHSVYASFANFVQACDLSIISLRNKVDRLKPWLTLR